MNTRSLRGCLVRFFPEPLKDNQLPITNESTQLIGICVDEKKTDPVGDIPNLICKVKGLNSGRIANVDMVNQYLRLITKEDLTKPQRRAYDMQTLY